MPDQPRIVAENAGFESLNKNLIAISDVHLAARRAAAASSHADAMQIANSRKSLHEEQRSTGSEREKAEKEGGDDDKWKELGNKLSELFSDKKEKKGECGCSGEGGDEGDSGETYGFEDMKDDFFAPATKGFSTAMDFLKERGDLEQSFARVGPDGQIDMDALNKELGELDLLTIRLTRNVPLARRQFYGLYESLEKGGLTAEQITQSAGEQAAHLVALTKGNAKEIGLEFGKMGSTLGFTPELYGKATDLFTKIFHESQVSPAQLMETARYFTPSAEKASAVTGYQGLELSSILFSSLKQHHLDEGISAADVANIVSRLGTRGSGFVDRNGNFDITRMFSTMEGASDKEALFKHLGGGEKGIEVMEAIRALGSKGLEDTYEDLRKRPDSRQELDLLSTNKYIKAREAYNADQLANSFQYLQPTQALGPAYDAMKYYKLGKAYTYQQFPFLGTADTLGDIKTELQAKAIGAVLGVVGLGPMAKAMGLGGGEHAAVPSAGASAGAVGEPMAGAAAGAEGEAEGLALIPMSYTGAPGYGGPTQATFAGTGVSRPAYPGQFALTPATYQPVSPVGDYASHAPNPLLDPLAPLRYLSGAFGLSGAGGFFGGRAKATALEPLADSVRLLSEQAAGASKGLETIASSAGAATAALDRLPTMFPPNPAGAPPTDSSAGVAREKGKPGYTIPNAGPESQRIHDKAGAIASKGGGISKTAGVIVHYSPTLNVAAGVDVAGLIKILDRHTDAVIKKIEDRFRQRRIMV